MSGFQSPLAVPLGVGKQPPVSSGVFTVSGSTVVDRFVNQTRVSTANGTQARTD